MYTSCVVTGITHAQVSVPKELINSEVHLLHWMLMSYRSTSKLYFFLSVLSPLFSWFNLWSRQKVEIQQWHCCQSNMFTRYCFSLIYSRSQSRNCNMKSCMKRYTYICIYIPSSLWQAYKIHPYLSENHWRHWSSGIHHSLASVIECKRTKSRRDGDCRQVDSDCSSCPTR